MEVPRIRLRICTASDGPGGLYVIKSGKAKKWENSMRSGFIGLGNIGRPIACDLARAGALTVFDKMPEGPQELRALGAQVADSPAGVAREADFVGVCVVDDRQVREVITGDNGLLKTARAGTLIAIHSTVRVATVHELAAAAARQGVRIVDAAVSRSADAQPSKSVVFMVGGESEDVARLEGILEPAALKFVRAGKLGAGMTLKICNNILSYLIMVCAADAMRLAEAAGLDLNTLAQVTSTNGVGGANLRAILERRASAHRQPTRLMPSNEALVGLAMKDLDCALEVGKDLGVKDMRATQLARDEFKRSLEAFGF
jgi:3-hydroxyisobutyrate dehydrogenase